LYLAGAAVELGNCEAFLSADIECVYVCGEINLNCRGFPRILFTTQAAYHDLNSELEKMISAQPKNQL
jgi:hypothetical protein